MSYMLPTLQMCRRMCLCTSLRAFRPLYFSSRPAYSVATWTCQQSRSIGIGSRQCPSTKWRSEAGSLSPEPYSDPRVPLPERPAAFETDLAAVLAWRERALAAVEAVGDTWVAADAGPSGEDLRTELGWLLDDAVGGAAMRDGGEAPATTVWRWLERELRAGAIAPADWLVRLREPLGTLGERHAAAAGPGCWRMTLLRPPGSHTALPGWPADGPRDGSLCR